MRRHSRGRYRQLADHDPPVATHAWDLPACEGVGARNLQDLMGHSPITTTSKYVHPVTEAMRREISKLRLPKRKKAKR